MTFWTRPALLSFSQTAATCSAAKLGPLFDPRRMTCVASLPSVSTIAERPCLVTERNVWDEAAARIASTAMSIEPSCDVRRGGKTSA